MAKRLAAVALTTFIATTAQAQDGSRVRTTMRFGMELSYEVVDGWAIHAGEIILGTADEVAKWGTAPSPMGAVPTSDRPDGSPCRWPNGIVPYVIDASVPEREALEVLKAVRTWDSETVLRFVERTPQQRDYVRFASGPLSGSSWCSRGGPIGEHLVLVENGDSADNLLHVLGHTIGLEHENQRRDRDSWLAVFRDNIAETPYARDAWHPKRSFGPDIGPYDYRSIMHYWFIEPGKQRNHARPYAAETIPPGMPFGAAGELSPGDVDSVARLYGHVPSEHTISTNPAGLEIIVDGERATAPASFAWEPGSEHTLEVPALQFRDGSRFLFGRWSDDGGRVHTITATHDTTLYQASFIAQHQVSTGVRVWCRDANETCSPEDISITVSPESLDGYYTLRTPIEVAVTPTSGSPLRLLWWDVDTDYYWGGMRQFMHGAASNPANTFSMSELTYEAVVGNGPIFRVESNVDPVRIAVGDWSGPTPAVFLPDALAGFTSVGRRPHATRGRGYRHRFRNWSDGGDETHAIEVPRDADTTLRLTLDTEYRLTTRAWQDFHGNRILVTPSSEDGWYPEGTEVRLRASPEPPAKFLGWNGAVSGRDPAALVTMDDGQFVEAVFDTWSTELVPAVPVEVSLQGRQWEGSVPDFERYYVVPPPDVSEIDVEFRTRAATGGEAALFVADTDLWPNWVRHDAADLVLRAGEIASTTVTRPPKRWPAAYFILVRAGDSDSGARLEGTLVARVSDHNRKPQAVGTLEDRTLSSGGAALVLDVARAFADPDGDLLTYTAVSSSAGVAAVALAGSMLTVTPVGPGSATVTVTATDPGGASATQQFEVAVAARATFTDHPITPGATPIKAVHFVELRARIDALRIRRRLPPFAWTDPTLVAGVTRVKRAHLTELRSALDAVYDAVSRPRPTYTDATAAAGAISIKAAHVMELRTAVLAVE